MHFNYSGRLFTFGCSFTQYTWPTWADILGEQFKVTENWGRSGSGNQYIFLSLIEAISSRKITSDDTVIIMWSTVNRHDWYREHQWHGHGDIDVNSAAYPTDVIENFLSDNKGALMRDLAYITAAKAVLKSANIPHEFLSIAPIINESYIGISKGMYVDDIEHVYSNTISLIKPSVLEVIFHGDWFSRPGIAIGKTPPAVIADSSPYHFSEKVKQWAYSVVSKRDPHPTPAEHLEYLEKTFPDIEISEYTRDRVSNANKMLLAGDIFEWYTGTQNRL